MAATTYGNERRERTRRIRAAENAVAIAAVQYVEALDAQRRDPCIETREVVESRHFALIRATRHYTDEVRS